MISPGDILPLTIEKPAVGGPMIARVEGLVVLVSGAIPGERVSARVSRVGKGVAYADTLSVDEPSADRRVVEADPLCGGCLYFHIAYPRQLAIKAQIIADAFARIGRLTLPSAVDVRPSPESGYRMRARLHLRGGRFGFFREGTHDICDARQTQQLLPATSDVLDRFASALRSLLRDTVREIELSENVDASERVVALDSVAAIDAETVDRLASDDGLSGIVAASGTHGSAYVTDRLAVGDSAPVVVRRHVAAFFQGNRYLLRDLVTLVSDHVPPNAQVVDLYAGVGIFSVGVAVARSARVTAVEGDRIAAADLVANAVTASDSMIALHQSVEEFTATTRESPDVVIVDPPRTGMSREALAGAIGLRADRVIYVSCDVATLARDARRFVDAGYEIERVDAFDLFPNTPHVETVVVFQRM
jgi:23S rRNA (uracil1939-C5)-methyltransferase